MMKAKTLNPADAQLIRAIQQSFPVEAYGGEKLPTKLNKNIAPWRSKLCRIALAPALGLLGDVLIDVIIGHEQFDDIMLIYYFDIDGAASRDEAKREFECLTKRQRRVVADWLHHVSSFPLAAKDPEAFDRALKFWDGFAHKSKVSV